MSILSYLKIGGSLVMVIGIGIFLAIANGWHDKEKVLTTWQTQVDQALGVKADGAVQEIDNLKTAIAAVKTTTVLAKADDIQHARETETVNNQTGQESANAYEAKIAAIRADYAQRLRAYTKASTDHSCSGHEDMSGASATPCEPSATSSQNGLPPIDAEIATEQATQLSAILDWGKKVGIIADPKNPKK